MGQLRCMQGDLCDGHPGDLLEHRSLIRQLYVGDDMSLKAVMKVLKDEHGINVSPNMLKKKLRQWKVNKSSSRSQALARKKELGKVTLPGRLHAFKAQVAELPAYEPQVQARAQRDQSSTRTGTKPTYCIPRRFASGTFESVNTLTMHNVSDWRQCMSDQLTCSSWPFSVASHPSANCGDGTGFMSNNFYLLGDNCNSNPGFFSSNRFSKPSKFYAPSPILQHMSLPTAMKTPEELYYAVRHYTASRVESRLIPEAASSPQEMRPQPKLALSRRRRLKSPKCCNTFSNAVDSGFVLTKLGPKPMAASLDQALREIEPVLQSNHFSIIQLMASSIHNKRQALETYPYISEMLLKQMYATARTLFGPHHPHAIWTHNLIHLANQPGILSLVIKACADAVQDVLGPEDPYSITARNIYLSHSMQEGRPSGKEILEKYLAQQSLLEKNSPGNERFLVNCKDFFAEIAIKCGEYEIAESIVKDSLDVLEEWLVKGSDELNTTGVAFILQNVTFLARALTYQDKYEEAYQVWRKALSVSTSTLGYHDPLTVLIISYFGDYLAQRHLDEDAMRMYATVDERLSPYMLERQAEEQSPNMPELQPKGQSQYVLAPKEQAVK